MSLIRVGVRGVAGLLGSRLAAAIAQSSDMELTVGVLKNDATLTRMIERSKFGGLRAKATPTRIYLDESDRVVAKVNASTNGRMGFLPLSALNLNRECDIVVDAAASAKHHALQEQYQQFPGCVVLQDGCYPYGRLIAPPLLTPSQGGNRYRQGGCFLSGVVPVLSAFRDEMESVRIHLVMQYDGRDSDFTITERLNTFRVADTYIPRMKEELSQLFPGMEINIERVIQIHGMLHYAVTLAIEARGAVSRETVLERLAEIPRVRILPDPIESTYEVNLARAIEDRMPPILVFAGSLTVTTSGEKSTIQMVLALYYRTLAVLPNLDAVRILARGVEPAEAMRQTDRDMGFSDSA